MAKKPNIRFAGFEDDWEQRKLGDYLEVSKQKNKRESFGREDVLSVSGEFGIVNQIEFQGRSFAGVSVANYGVVEYGDVVYTKSPLKSNPYGIVKTNKGKSGIVSTLYAVYKPKNNVDSEFIQIYFESDFRMNTYMHPLVNKGAKNDMKVSDENVLKGPVVFPKIEEQRAISQHFKQLDHLITLHQRKCDELKKVKKFMLQKMFPKKGEKNPEIRFDGFTNDWEQRKLEDVLEVLKDGTHGTHADVDNGVYLLSAKNIKNGCVSVDENDRQISVEEYEKIHTKFKLKNGDVLMTIVGTIGESAILESVENITFQRSVAFLRPNNELLNSFLFQTIYTKSFQKELDNRKATGAQPGIYLGEVAQIPIMIPTNINEQAKISSYFSYFDHLITLHQRKCEELKNVKKYMLQNMFAKGE